MENYNPISRGNVLNFEGGQNEVNYYMKNIVPIEPANQPCPNLNDARLICATGPFVGPLWRTSLSP